MALWKLYKGSREALDIEPKHDGYVYFCDDGSLHYDYVDADGNLQRKQINAKDAETLTGMTFGDIIEAAKVEVDSSLSATSVNPVQNKVITSKFNSLAAVATSGSYNDLTDKPTVENKVSQFNLTDDGVLFVEMVEPPKQYLHTITVTAQLMSDSYIDEAEYYDPHVLTLINENPGSLSGEYSHNTDAFNIRAFNGALVKGYEDCGAVVLFSTPSLYLADGTEFICYDGYFDDIVTEYNG